MELRHLRYFVAVAESGSTGNVEAAKKVGTAVAEMARGKNIDKVVFNRNGFLYHGRVKALAEAARVAGGLDAVIVPGGFGLGDQDAVVVEDD